jgi:zinc transport system substrate-binding protein
MREGIVRFVLCGCIVMAIAGCSRSDPQAAVEASVVDTGRPLSVYVVNYPLQYFAERVGGTAVRVSLPVPGDTDPAFWKPGPEQIAAYQAADLILLNGASYAKWVDRASLPASRTVDTSASFADRLIRSAGDVTHRHGEQGVHDHGDVAFPTWLDPLQAIAQAKAIADALVRLRPDMAEAFNERFESLEADLLALDAQLASLGSNPDFFLDFDPCANTPQTGDYMTVMTENVRRLRER